jgi:hypothetical protein
MADDRIRLGISSCLLGANVRYDGGGNGSGGRVGAEPGDQREDQQGDPAEESLVKADEDPKRLAQREDELPIGEGSQEVLVRYSEKRKDRFGLQSGRS